jgi:hypothetical protein
MKNSSLPYFSIAQIDPCNGGSSHELQENKAVRYSSACLDGRSGRNVVERIFGLELAEGEEYGSH